MDTSPIGTIALDGKRALYNFTGLGNYSRYAIAALSAAMPFDEFRVYAHKRLPSQVPFEVPHNVSIVTPESLYGRKLGSLWRHWGGLSRALRRDGVQLYHGLSNELPFDIARAGIPSVVTIHDLIFRRIPENYKPVDRRLYDWKFSHAAREATRVIAISERTRADIMELYGVPAGKIDVVYQGCNPLFTLPVSDEERERVRKLYDLPPVFIAMVGTVEQRKNQLLVVEALRGLPSEVELVIVGRGRNNYGKQLRETIARYGLARRVKWLTGVPTLDLPAIYSLSTLSAYPSRYEGFGLPVIEAINCGTPVVAATGSCLEEAGGPGALYVSPDSAEEFAAAASCLLSDTALHSRMVAEGREYVARFSPLSFAEHTLDTYHTALREYSQK